MVLVNEVQFKMFAACAGRSLETISQRFDSIAPSRLVVGYF